MMAVHVKDLQEKQFTTTCSTSHEGQLHDTKHGKIKCPKVVEKYLQMAAVIDVHNHVRTGSSWLEDDWPTKVTFTVSLQKFLVLHLAATYFTEDSDKKSIIETCHVNFKIKLANQLFFISNLLMKNQDLQEPVKQICIQGTNLFH